MVEAVIGNLTMVGLHTVTPKVFWKGQEVVGISRIQVNVDVDDETEVKLKVNGNNDVLYMEMVDSGINIKKGK